MNHLFLITLTLFSTLSLADLLIELPKDWSISGTIIYKNDSKIGEFTSKETWSYENGEEFVSSFKNGFVDDPATTEFVSGGKNNEIFWVCRKSEYSDGKGGGGIWFARRFWVNGPILTLYSKVSCADKFDEALKIASTVKEQ